MNNYNLLFCPISIPRKNTESVNFVEIWEIMPITPTSGEKSPYAPSKSSTLLSSVLWFTEAANLESFRSNFVNKSLKKL